MITYWDSGFGPGNWVIWKNVLVCFFGLFALYFGTKDSVEQIIKMYMPEANNTISAAEAINATSAFLAVESNSS